MPSSQLSDEDIERITLLVRDVVGDRVQANKIVTTGDVNTGKNDGGFRKLIDGLLILGVAALVAVVWNLSNSVSVLTTQVGYLSAEVQALRANKP